VATFKNTCEGTNGSNVTTANSAGPDQFTLVNIGTSCTNQYDTTTFMHGASAIKIATGATAAASYIRYNQASALSQSSGRFYI
jgi:hypothetical protein